MRLARALRHVNFGVAPGELVLVTGVSGCGKSTLALILAGLIPSRVHGELRGAVTFGGQRLSGLPPHQASQLVGMVFQNPNLQLINQTVVSEVAFGPENLALPQPEVAARVEWCLEVTGMAGLRRAAVVTLSGGQKQRTAIAATLAMRPGPGPGRAALRPRPGRRAGGAGHPAAAGPRGGTGVVVIEHRVDEVAPWADRVMLMDDGRVILDEPPRVAWADRGPWLATGVGLPDVVRLARACRTCSRRARRCRLRRRAGALLRDTWFVPALAAAAADRAPARAGGPPAGPLVGPRDRRPAGANRLWGAGAVLGRRQRRIRRPARGGQRLSGDP